MRYDPNELEMSAQIFFDDGKFVEALRIYFYLADGDPSLDAGYLAKRIADCYTKKNEIYAAYYWYGRAIEENPEIYVDCLEIRKKIEPITLDDILQ